MARFIEKHIEYIIFSSLLCVVLILNISINYYKYIQITQNNFYHTQANVINIYEKSTHNILKLKANSFVFYTKTENEYLKGDQLSLSLIIKDISFLDYMKGFFVNTINLNRIETKVNAVRLHIKLQRQNIEISELFDALFLAIPLSSKLREQFASFGISHLIAISGFHLGVLSFVLYWLLYPLYSTVHQRYCPYRNKKYDILIIVGVLLFSYLLFTQIVPSLLRAFVMFCFGIFLLRNKINILSFKILFFTLLIIIVFFPHYIFSLSLWFSVFGVFYIYLFLHYFLGLNKIIVFFFFNVWIYLALNPIIHYFFPITSYEQLLSPLFTILFSLFYPFELLAHLLTLGYILDPLITTFLDYKVNIFYVETPFYFVLFYLGVSLLSIFSKYSFYLLNILMFGFNIILFI